MIEINVKNIESFMNEYAAFLGEKFIEEADAYIRNPKYKNNQNKNYHPFFEYWSIFDSDIKTTKEINQLHISHKTFFLLDLLSNLKLLSKKYNISRLINSLLVQNKFYSSIFEIQILEMYSHFYNMQILEESSNSKSSDFLLHLPSGDLIYIECKALQDFEIAKNNEYKKLITRLQLFCKNKQKSIILIIKAGENFHKQNLDNIVNQIKKYIINYQCGEFKLLDLEIEFCIMPIAEWNVAQYGNGEILINHPPNAQFELTCEAEVLFNGVIAHKNFILIGVESKPILNFEKRIEAEIKKAKQQIPSDKSGIIHMQLPIHEEFDFEDYINKNFEKLKRILMNKTTRVNSLVISNPIYNMKNFNANISNIQYYVIPNMNVAKEIHPNFKYPFTNSLEYNIPDIDNIDSHIEFKNILYTPNFEWENIPTGTIQLNLISATGKTQFKFWKSYDSTITFDFIINGYRMCVKSEKSPFATNKINCIDVSIKNKQIRIFIDKQELKVEKFI